MSRFKTYPEDGTIIRGNGSVRIRKSKEETKDSDSIEPEAQDKSR